MGFSAVRPTGLTWHVPQRSIKGYTLITPMNGTSTYLLDMDGRVVHRWEFDATQIKPGYAKLLPNGRLLMRATDARLPRPPSAEEFTKPPPPLEDHVRRLGGNGRLLLEFDWDGNEVWRYEDDNIHHDMVRMSNGHTLLPRWVVLPEDFAKTVRGATKRPREKLPPLLGDEIVEIDGEGREVRAYQVWKQLDPRRDTMCPLERRWEWMHMNGIDVNADGDIAFSCRNNSTVGIIDGSSGELTWKYGFPEVAHQHNPTFVEHGHLQIFDNGMHRPGQPYSRILEVNPENDEVVWMYEANPRFQFFSSYIAGCDRLPGGNVLICEGSDGRVFEVTQSGEVVWEWINPFLNFGPGPGGSRSVQIFRAHRYEPDYGGLLGRDLNPDRYEELNRVNGL